MATVNCVQPDSASQNRLCNGLTEEVLVRVLDIADITREKGSDAAAADVVQVFSVAAGDLITDVKFISLVAGTATGTLGDDTDVDGFLAGIDTSATAGTMSGTTGAFLQAGTSPYAVTRGKLYAAANTIDLVLGGTVAKTEKFAVVIKKIALGAFV